MDEVLRMPGFCACLNLGMGLSAAIATERRSLADLLETLTPGQQQAHSLCSAWTVRQVAGHLVMPMEVGLPGFMVAMLRHRGDFDRANDALTRKQAHRPFAEIVGILRDKADHRFTPPGQGPEAPLTEVLVHGLDIARPLGLTHTVVPEHLRVALDHLAIPAAKARAADSGLTGLRLLADDLDWSHGEGPEVTGSATSLLLALAGRDVGWEDLSGAVPERGPKNSPE